MPNIQDIIKDPEFHSLPPEEQRKVFNSVDKDFSGLLPEEQDKVLSSFSASRPNQAQQTQQDKPYSWQDAIMDTLVGGGAVARNLPLSQQTKRTIINSADPALKGIGMGIGGSVGNTAFPIYGGMAGAGLGQAAGGGVSEILKSQLGMDENKSIAERLLGQAEDVISGATWEGIGQTAMPALGYMGKGVKKLYNYFSSPIRDQGAKETAVRAYESLIKQQARNPLFDQNIDEATKLGDELGTVFTRGQASNAPSTVMKERVLARSVPGGGETDVMKIAEQNKAIGKYFGKEFSKGNIDDLLSNVKQYGDDLARQTSKYSDDLTSQLSKLNTEKTPYQSGETMRSAKYALSNRRRPVVERLFNEVPNVPVDITPLKDKVDDIEKFIAEHKGYKPEDIPTQAINRVKEMIKDAKQQRIPFQRLREERNNIYSTLNNFRSELPPNDRLLQKTNEIKQAFEDSLNNIALHPPEVSQKYKKASDFYKKYYLPLKQGVSREMTAKNNLGEYRIDAEKIPQKIFNSVTDANQFISTLPKGEAKQAMRDYASNSLINNSTVYNPRTGDINQKAYDGWLARNKEVLKALGIHKDFEDISKTVTNLELAKSNQAVFDKSNLTKLLGVNPENAIANVFSGGTRKNSTAAMSDLINQIQKTPDPERAMNGLRKSFADYFVKLSESNLRDIQGQPIENITKGKEFIKSNLGAMKILYRDQPEKISALMKVQRGYEIMMRNQKSPFPGGGSPTAEHLLHITERIRIRHKVLKSVPLIGDAYIRLEQFGKQQADAYLMRALYDPEYAYTLINTIKNPIVFDSKVKGHMLGLAMQNSASAANNVLDENSNNPERK